MIRYLFIVGCLSATACQPEAGPPEGEATLPSGVPETAPAADPSDIPASLEGEYRVAGAGGNEVDLPWGMTVSIDADAIMLQSDCLAPEWSYALRDGELATRKVDKELCDRAREPVEDAAIAALDNAVSARRTPTNAIVLEGEGTSITLYTQ
ncbi:hypothetical protein [Qipengyuania sp. JC766]|uniref:hypothetical protein n=1 Tax=Qipengyuania sp. JC766 TaxID=3232139 RepID=UPI00345749C1